MTWLHYPGHLAAGLIVVALVALFVFGFRADPWRSLNWRRWLLPVLQIIPPILVLLLLWDPSYARTREKEMPNTVLAVFDTSESMSVEDVDGAKRLDKAIEAFERVFRPGAADVPEFAIYGFDSTLHEADAPRALPRWGSLTTVSPVVELLQKSALANNANAKRRVVGAVIFTDGQAIEKTAAALPAVAGKDFHVTIVGVGADESPGDIAVTGIDAPARALLDTGIPIRVAIGGRLPEGVAAHLEVASDGVPVAMRDINSATLSSGGTMEFAVPARLLGPLEIEARVTMAAPDANTANDRRQAIVNVIEEPRLNVLFYSQWANFDIGKMREVLSLENKVALDFSLDVLKQDSRGTVAPLAAGPDTRKLPDTREAMNAYDVVVLGPVNIRGLTPGQIDALYSFVAERGGGLLILPGEDQFDLAASHDPKLKALLPGLLKPGASGRSSVQVPIEISPEGRAAGLPNSEELDKPPADLMSYYQLEAKPASTVAARYDNAPAIVFQRVGRGNVGLLNLRRLYLLYKDKDGGALRKLVSGIVTHLGASARDAAQIQIYAERLPEEPRSVLFTANVFDAQFHPSTRATVLLTLGGQTYRMEELAGGSYRATVVTHGEETFIAKVEAVMEGVLIGEATTTARLPLPSGEMDRVERNRPFLKAAAEQLGGDYIDLDKLTPQVVSYPASSRVEEVADVASAWRTWTLLVVLCALLSGAWFARRMMGLV